MTKNLLLLALTKKTDEGNNYYLQCITWIWARRSEGFTDRVRPVTPAFMPAMHTGTLHGCDPSLEEPSTHDLLSPNLSDFCSQTPAYSPLHSTLLLTHNSHTCLYTYVSNVLNKPKEKIFKVCKFLGRIHLHCHIALHLSCNLVAMTFSCSNFMQDSAA